ncbi:hypothetical protein ACFCW6_29420 [Streptomyces sp. NPDC056333]
MIEALRLRTVAVQVGGACVGDQLRLRTRHRQVRHVDDGPLAGLP